MNNTSYNKVCGYTNLHNVFIHKSINGTDMCILYNVSGLWVELDAYTHSKINK